MEVGENKIKMEWSRSETLALAQQSCCHCYGLGLRPGRDGVSTPCNCVFRAIFRVCYNRFCKNASKEKYISRVSLEANPGRQRKQTWGLKNEEYMADFCLVSRRVLDDAQYRIFRFHFLLGGDWKLCCRQLGMDRGEFFHEVYRIEQKLGRAFRELEPYALFPLDEYFGGTRKNGEARQETASRKLAKVLAFPVPPVREAANAPAEEIQAPLEEAA